MVVSTKTSSPAASRVEASAGAVANGRELGPRGEHEHRVAPAERNDPGGASRLADLLREQAERGLSCERVLERAPPPRVVARLPLREPEPERRDEPGVSARVDVALVPEHAPIGKLELALDGGDGRAHPRRGGIDGAERPAEPEQRAVDPRVLAVDAPDGARRIAQAALEDRRRLVTVLVRAADPA